MVVTYGTVCPAGHLPVFSVDTEDEVRELIARCCEQVWVGRGLFVRLGYVANELEAEQTPENLYAFGKRLAAEYVRMKGEDDGKLEKGLA